MGSWCSGIPDASAVRKSNRKKIAGVRERAEANNTLPRTFEFVGEALNLSDVRAESKVQGCWIE